MINLSEPTHSMNNTSLNLHGHRTHRSQDIITSYLTKNKLYLFYFSKNMACFIFLVKTKLTQEPSKFGITKQHDHKFLSLGFRVDKPKMT
jgi:hypothetical protein